MDERVLQLVKRATNYPRAILATSYAEMAITIPDVDFVIDLGLCREIRECEGFLQIRDLMAPRHRGTQRLGRVGRVKVGGYARLKVLSPKVTGDEQGCSVDSLQRVLALAPYHERILAKSLSLCAIPSEVIRTAHEELMLRTFSQRRLRKVLITPRK